MNPQAATAAETATPQLYQLDLKRTFNTSREAVFRAWTDPKILAKWFGPEGVIVSAAEVDLKVGGASRVAMVPPGGAEIVHFGTYREIDAPARLVFTWILENQDCEGSASESGETLVTVDLRDVGGRTELALKHELLPSETARDGHEMDWTGCLNSLDTMLG